MNKYQDHQEVDQFPSFIGILKKSIIIILSHPKIFTQITIAFILPLFLIRLAFDEFVKLPFQNMPPNISLFTLDFKELVSSFRHNYHDYYPSFPLSKSLIFLAITIFIRMFSLVPPSALIYTTGCIYTGKRITFKNVMNVIPKLWKRLVITGVTGVCIMSVASLAIICFAILYIYVFFNIIVLQVILILLIIGVYYTSILWQLDYVISIMEINYGILAMIKSRQLIKGKLAIAIAMYFLPRICSVPITISHRLLIGPSDSNVGIGLQILDRLISLVFGSLIMLYISVVQSMYYFVLKSYHNERIDKSSLAAHLESFQHG